MECDSKIVSDALMGSCVPLVTISNILEGIGQKLLAFRLAWVSHVKRQGNKTTDVLPKYAKEVDNLRQYIKAEAFKEVLPRYEKYLSKILTRIN